MGVAEKIKEIEDEMARTQKNKNTEHHLGKLKAQLAKLRRELLEDGSKGGPGSRMPYFQAARALLYRNSVMPEYLSWDFLQWESPRC